LQHFLIGKGLDLEGIQVRPDQGLFIGIRMDMKVLENFTSLKNAFMPENTPCNLKLNLYITQAKILGV
jgi:hypothetical protein